LDRLHHRPPLDFQNQGFKSLTMSEHGGRREGAGRPRGSRNPNTKAKREAIKAVVAQFEATTPNVFAGDAVALMQLIYRDPSQDMGLRLDAAKSAAKFERPTLAAVAVQQMPKARIDLSALSASEREQLAGLLQKLMAGRTGAAALSGEVARDFSAASRE